MSGPGIETELKFRVEDFELIRRRLLNLGGTCIRPMTFEDNVVFDDAVGTLRQERKLLRLRQGDDVRLTWKEPIDDERFKVRREVEVRLDDFGAMKTILERLGFRPSARYQREREIWQIGDAFVLLDHTPIGDYLELEADPEALERLVYDLGLDRQRGITKNYLELFADVRRESGLAPDEMVFPGRG